MNKIKAWNRLSLRAIRKRWPCRHFDLELLISSPVRVNFCCFKPPVCGILLWQPQQTNTANYPIGPFQVGLVTVLGTILISLGLINEQPQVHRTGKDQSNLEMHGLEQRFHSFIFLRRLVAGHY